MQDADKGMVGSPALEATYTAKWRELCGSLGLKKPTQEIRGGFGYRLTYEEWRASWEAETEKTPTEAGAK